MRGERFELKSLRYKFGQMMDEYCKEKNLKFFMGFIDSVLVKYGAFNLGLSILSLPVFGPGKEKYLLRVGNNPSQITRDYE